MNPPTIGHEKLVKRLVDVARRAKADPMIFLSHTQDKKRNPLDYNTKIRITQRAFGKIVKKTPARSVIQVLQQLEKIGYKQITMVVGSDRVIEFKSLFDKYNGRDFTFDKINVVTAGQRDPDAEGVEGMSASKVRALAIDGDYENFKRALPKIPETDKKKVFNMIKRMNEETETVDEVSLNLMQRMKKSRLMKRLAPKIARMRKIKMQRMASTGHLKKRAQREALKIMKKRVAGDRGADYKNLSPSQKQTIDKLLDGKKSMVNRIAKRVMPKVRSRETSRLASLHKHRNEEYLGEMKLPSQSEWQKDMERRHDTMPKGYHKPEHQKKMYDAHIKGIKDWHASQQKEEVVNELSRGTLTRYNNAAQRQSVAGYKETMMDKPNKKLLAAVKRRNSARGIAAANKKLAKEENIDEMDQKTWKRMRSHSFDTRHKDAKSKNVDSSITNKRGDEVPHIEMQLRTAVSLRGQHDIKFASGEKTRISMNSAIKAQAKLKKLSPKDRQNTIRKMMTSKKHFHSVVKEDINAKFEALFSE
jgi:hypothetical protein